MSDREDLYRSYLDGFAGFAAAPTTLADRAAYALGQRDRAETGPGLPFLRAFGSVVEEVRKLVPSPQSVPVDVDGMFRALQETGARLHAAEAKLAAVEATHAA